MISIKDSQLLSTTLKLLAPCVLPRSRNHILLSYGVHTDQIFLAFSSASLNIIIAWKNNFKTTCRTGTRKFTGDTSHDPLHEQTGNAGHSCTLCKCLERHQPFFVASITMAFKGQFLLLLSCLIQLTLPSNPHWFGPSALYLTKHKVK